MPGTSTSAHQIWPILPKYAISGTGAKRATRPTGPLKGILPILKERVHPFPPSPPFASAQMPDKGQRHGMTRCTGCPG